MNPSYGGLNPLDGPEYWRGLSANPNQAPGSSPIGSRGSTDVSWVNVDGTLYPVAGSGQAQSQPQPEQDESRAQARALMRAQREAAFRERQQKIITDLEAGAQAMEAYGLGGLVPLSALGVDGTTGARAAGLSPSGMALPVTPDAWRLRPMPSGQPSSAPTAAPLPTSGNLGGALNPSGANRYAYSPPSWAGGK